MSVSKGGLTQTKKQNSGLIVLDADFDGTVSANITIDGDMPIVGLLIDLSAAGTCTIQLKEDGKTFQLLSSDRTAVLTIGDGVLTEIGGFIPELAPFKNFTITASTTQTNAVIYGMLSS